jgi:hypothetical protein
MLAGDWTRLQELTGRVDPPNLIVAGGAGTGKSAALRSFLTGSITMWLRCSTDISLRDSRDRIKSAAQKRVEAGRVAWIVLEHADMLHTDAQAFLRRIIETSLGSTRFVLEVRDLAAIAEPLVSRCVLFHAPQLLRHEIRTEIQGRAPSCPSALAERLAAQAGGNVRWATVQAIGGGDGFLADGLSTPASVSTWQDLLGAMEALQQTGSSPRAWLESMDPVWERPGGADPWALLAASLARQIV